MSKTTNSLSTTQNIFHCMPLPTFPSKKSVEDLLKQQTYIWEKYSEFPDNMKQELIGFCTGKHGLKITYDPVFRKIFSPSLHPDRLEAFLSAILGRSVRIIRVIPREGTRLNEQTSFVVMDVLVQLDDGSYANVEIQKIGYNFPLARADCYASDIIMRQYAQVRMEQGPLFSFQNLHKVYCIILMEKSPMEFHTVKGKYIHRRISSFDTDIYAKSSGLHEDIFICLDSFHSIVHNITKDSITLDAWLTFLSTTDISTIASLIEAFPHFMPIYQEIADFTNKPEELINMLSEELYIMTKNLERLMVNDLQDEVNALHTERDVLKAERDSVKEECDSIKAERDSVKAECDSVKAERDSAKAECDSVKAECDSVKAECDSAKAERDSAKAECDSAKAERDSAKAEMATEREKRLTAERKLQQVLSYAKAYGYHDGPDSFPQ